MNNWIPVTERLPEIFLDDEFLDKEELTDNSECRVMQHYSSNPVLVCTARGFMDIRWFSKYAWKDNGEVDCESFANEDLNDRVLAWMPLPEPYEEDDMR